MWQAFRRAKKDECSRTREMLSGYVDRRLKPEELARVEGHLRTCPGCRKELESLRATVTLLQGLPEATPARSFTLAPMRALPGRRTLQALRFATAGAAILLVLSFAADRTDMFRENPFSRQQLGTATLGPGAERASEDVKPYWVVPGVQNNVDGSSDNVDLVVPDGSDNVYEKVDSLASANDGVILGAMVTKCSVPQMVVRDEGEDNVKSAQVQEFSIVYGPDGGGSQFSTSGGAPSGWSAANITLEASGSSLNMLNSDNSVLYSFDLSQSRLEYRVVHHLDWVRVLVYSLIGVLAALAAATLAFWYRQRRRRAIGAA